MPMSASFSGRDRVARGPHLVGGIDHRRAPIDEVADPGAVARRIERRPPVQEDHDRPRRAAAATRAEDRGALGAASDVDALGVTRELVGRLSPARSAVARRDRSEDSSPAAAASSVAAQHRGREHADEEDDGDEDGEQQRPHAAAIGPHYARRPTRRTSGCGGRAAARRAAGPAIEKWIAPIAPQPDSEAVGRASTPPAGVRAPRAGAKRGHRSARATKTLNLS